MKNKFVILALSLMLTGCAATSAQQQSYIPAYSKTSEALGYVNPAQEAREAFAEHFGSDFPSNYQGIYFDMEIFVIQISDDDISPYDFLSEYGDLVRIETVKYTQEELEELRDIPWNILYEHSIEIVSSCIDQKSNAIRIEIFDQYTDEEKAEISSYVEEYPVVIKYVNSYPVLL